MSVLLGKNRIEILFNQNALPVRLGITLLALNGLSPLINNTWHRHSELHVTAAAAAVHCSVRPQHLALARSLDTPAGRPVCCGLQFLPSADTAPHELSCTVR